MNSFKKRVYEVVKRIPKGKVATYGQVGQMLGSRRLARAVGNALHHNPYARVPCHRVVNSRGGLANNFGKGGRVEQKKRLTEEGVEFEVETRVDMESCRATMDLA